jgi:hypothetical protein
VFVGFYGKFVIVLGKMLHSPPLCSTHILYNIKNKKSSTFRKKIKKIRIFLNNIKKEPKKIKKLFHF